MTLAFFGALIGVILGIRRARKAQGNKLDQAQYAAVYGILFALAGMLASIVIARGL